ncbi:hypothetical protein [Flavobacterium stagni]|uniref:Lipoprotein n=1 Tax=Flavobacterium stagni TaxID=2506421 RepID=A0A4Q1K9T8_9FLAO|nr:hypothetical protein [Flavobacterium stagni]RXR22618.1 hypothetical protein EQG61_08535 [Flavobacterium stagni]
MKHFLLFFLITLIACQNQEKSKQAPEIKSEAPVQSDLETRVTQQIEKIQQSTPAQRRQELLRFIELADQVDGASGEIYGNFAFEYVEEHPADFFSVLRVGDSVLVKKWAKASASEVQILGDTPEGIDSVFVEVKSNHQTKKGNSTPTEIQLEKRYLDQLKKEISK